MTDETAQTTPIMVVDPDLWPRRSDDITKVAAAFTKAQAEIEHAVKDETNEHFNNKYADLAGVIDAYREHFAKHGLAVLQPSLRAPRGCIRIQTIILHESGQHLADGGLTLPGAKDNAQGLGGSITYARRYAMASLVGVAQEDDDGNTASGVTQAKSSTTRKREPSVKLAKKADRDAVSERIKGLSEAHRDQVAERLRTDGVAWTSISVDQLKTVVGWVEACEAIESKPVDPEPQTDTPSEEA